MCSKNWKKLGVKVLILGRKSIYSAFVDRYYFYHYDFSFQFACYFFRFAHLQHRTVVIETTFNKF